MRIKCKFNSLNLNNFIMKLFRFKLLKALSISVKK